MQDVVRSKELSFHKEMMAELKDLDLLHSQIKKEPLLLLNYKEMLLMEEKLELDNKRVKDKKKGDLIMMINIDLINHSVLFKHLI